MNKGHELFAPSCRHHARKTRARTGALLALGAGLWTLAGTAEANTIVVSAEEWRAMQEQNRQLHARLEAQQSQIDDLRHRFERLPTPDDRVVSTSTAFSDTHIEFPEPPPTSGRRIIVGGEVGVAFFAGQADTAFPHDEFRVDDARLTVEAEVARNVYVFTELDLTRRETADEFFRLGECHIEVAELPAPWSGDDTFTVRAGRLDGGYLLVGHGTFGDYFFSSNLTDYIERFGLGLGYDPAENFRLKVEYTWEHGRLTNGAVRDETDQLAAEAGVKF